MNKMIDFALFTQIRTANDRLLRAFNNDDCAQARVALISMLNDATKLLVKIDQNNPFQDDRPLPELVRVDPRPRVRPTQAQVASAPSGKAPPFPWEDHPVLERELVEAFLTGTLPTSTMIKQMMSRAAGFQVTDGHWRNKIHNHRPPQFIYDRVKPSDHITWEMIWVAGAYLMRHDPVEGARKGNQWIRHIALYLGRDLSCGKSLPVFSRKERASINALIRLALPSPVKRHKLRVA